MTDLLARRMGEGHRCDTGIEESELRTITLIRTTGLDADLYDEKSRWGIDGDLMEIISVEVSSPLAALGTDTIMWWVSRRSRRE